MRTFATNATRATSKALTAMLPDGAENGRLIVVGALTVDDAIVIGRDRSVSPVLLASLQRVARGDVAAIAAEQLKASDAIPDMSRVFLTYTTKQDDTGRTTHHLTNFTINQVLVPIATAYRTGSDGPVLVELARQTEPATEGVESRATSTASYLARGRDNRIDRELKDILDDLEHALRDMPRLRAHSDERVRKGRQADKLLDLSARLARAAGDAAVVEGLLDTGAEV